MIERARGNEEPWHVETRTDERGRLIIPAFTLQRSIGDDGYIYWTVNLHDQVIDSGEQAMIQLFHEREDAERFIADHKGKIQ